MTESEQSPPIGRLRALQTETEWSELKKGRIEPQVLVRPAGPCLPPRLWATM